MNEAEAILPRYTDVFEDQLFLRDTPLTNETVLQYFALSRFAIDTKLSDDASMNDVRVIEDAIDGGFLIKKSGPFGAEYFYCVSGIIYRAPPVYSVLSSKMVRYEHMCVI